MKKPIDIGHEVSFLMSSYHGFFPAKRCLTIENGVASQNAKPTPIYIEGDVISIGTTDYNLAGSRTSELVMVNDEYSNNLYSLYGDTLTLKTTYADGGFLTLDFERYRGVRGFTYSTASISLICTQPK